MSDRWFCTPCGAYHDFSAEGNPFATDPIENRRDERVRFAIDRFKKELRLDQWDIRYDPVWDPKNDTETATANYRMNEQVATIRLHPDVTGDNIDAHVAHELAHLVMADYRHMAFNIISKAGEHNVPILDLLQDMEERICDSIAHALTGVTYIPVDTKARDWHAPFVA